MKQENSSESQTLHSENGRPPEKLTLLEAQKEVTDSMTQKLLLKKEVKPSEKKKKNKQAISIVESPALPKKKILKGKSNSLNVDIQTMKLSKISQAELTLREKDSTKYWLTQCKDLSKKLWLPTETGSVGSHMNTSAGCSNSTELISSSKINRNIVQNMSSTKICSQLSTYSPHDTMVLGGNIQINKLKNKLLTKLKQQESTKHTKLKKTDPERIKKVITDDLLTDYSVTSKRIKVTPLNNTSRRTINDGIAISRKIWNCCVTAIQKEPKLTYDELRDKFVTEKKMSKKSLKEMDWTFRIQQKVREAVIRRFSANYKTSQDNFEKYKRKYFYKIKQNKKTKVKKKIVMNFRDKNAEKQTIYLNKEVCKFRVCSKTGKTILETFNGVELTLQEPYRNFNKETTCIRCQHIFNSVSLLKKHMEIKTPCKEVSTDSIPHAGIPQAELILQRIGYEYYLYVPEHSTPEIKEDDASTDIVAIDAGWNTLLTYFSPDGEWGEICPGIKDKINSLRDKLEIIKSQNVSEKRKKKAIQKRLVYINNMMDDLHWKLCHWLLSKFRKVIISRLYVSTVGKRGKLIQADLKLCLFVDRLIHKSMEYKNREIHVCKEHYTSKACTNCLSLNTVKGRTVRCKSCKHEIHRDLNGARNIFLKHCY